MVRKRHEMKYAINYTDYLVLNNRIRHILKPDFHNEGTGYKVTSLYFDDIMNKAVAEKINGEPIRHKYRIRYYGQDKQMMKLERKSKINQMTAKDSVPLTRDEVQRVLDGDTLFLMDKDEKLYREFYYALNKDRQKPKVIVQYEREAYVHPLGDLRITFDRHIKTCPDPYTFLGEDIAYIGIQEEEPVLLEVKFNGILPSYIGRLLETGHGMQTSASKYVYSRKYNLF